MKRSRGRAGRARGPSGLPGRSEVYDELLQEALENAPVEALERALKRRKSQRGDSDVIVIDEPTGQEAGTSQKGVMVISSAEEQEEENDSEIEWDDVELNPNAMSTSDAFADTQTSPLVREVTISQTPQKHTFGLCPCLVDS
jgi:hypothetical protein